MSVSKTVLLSSVLEARLTGARLWRIIDVVRQSQGLNGLVGFVEGVNGHYEAYGPAFG